MVHEIEKIPGMSQCLAILLNGCDTSRCSQLMCKQRDIVTITIIAVINMIKQQL